MASSSNGPSCSVVFTTRTSYPLPSQKYMIPASWKRYQLSELVNKALSLTQPVPFDFLIRGQILSTSIQTWCTENGVGEEETLEIEYIESVLPPQKISDLPHDDWVSSVSCAIQGHFLTASYDGKVRVFDYSNNLVSNFSAHPAPVTSVCLIPGTEDGARTVATASHDLTGQISRLSLSSSETKALATLHLHTSPLSSITSNSTGSHLLTSSWDCLIGLWDTTIPSQDEVSSVPVDGERKKRRKLAEKQAEESKRKAPLSVLKSHTARVSKVIFGNAESGKGESVAYSCGFDSTVRTWDVENGICTNTVTASEKPFLDISLTSDGNIALAASTDRTIMLYDLRTSSSTTSVGSMMHPATPSCIVPGSSPQKLMSGAYDGIVRIWDIRSLKTAVMTFSAWDGQKKILSIDWKGGVAGIAGEGGLEVWRAGEDKSNPIIDSSK